MVVRAQPNKQGATSWLLHAWLCVSELLPSQNVGGEYNCGFLVFLHMGFIIRFSNLDFDSKPGYSRICPSPN